MVFKDDRTPEQKRTHTLVVMMTDLFMSGWGGAGRGAMKLGRYPRPVYSDPSRIAR